MSDPTSPTTDPKKWLAEATSASLARAKVLLDRNLDRELKSFMFTDAELALLRAVADKLVALLEHYQSECYAHEFLEPCPV